MTADRIYSTLLVLYPKEFRDEFGHEMLSAFRDMRRRHSASGIRFWSFVVCDIVASAAEQRMESLQWLATSALGLFVTVGAAHAVTWTYSYFYHPYFEGTLIPALPYGIVLGLVLGGTIGAAQWVMMPAMVRRASRWATASAVALPLAVLFCSAALDRAMTGLDPVAQIHPRALDVLVLGLGRPSDWVDLATEFTAMAAAALVVRAVLLKPRLLGRHAH